MADMQSQSAPEQAREKVQDAAANVQQQARGRLSEQVDQRSTQVGQQVGSTAQALRQTSEQLREQGQDGPARFVEQAAGRIDRAGSWLSESDGDTLLRDVEDFGRRNPWAVVAAGVAAGFAASRLLKASSERRAPQRGYGRTGNGYYGSGAAPYPGAAGYTPGRADIGGAPMPPTTPPQSTTPGPSSMPGTGFAPAVGTDLPGQRPRTFGG